MHDDGGRTRRELGVCLARHRSGDPDPGLGLLRDRGVVRFGQGEQRHGNAALLDHRRDIDEYAVCRVNRGLEQRGPPDETGGLENLDCRSCHASRAHVDTGAERDRDQQQQCDNQSDHRLIVQEHPV